MIHSHKQGRCSNIIASNKASELKKAVMDTKIQDTLGTTMGGQQIVKIENLDKRILLARCPICGDVRPYKYNSLIIKDKLKSSCKTCHSDTVSKNMRQKTIEETVDLVRNNYRVIKCYYKNDTPIVDVKCLKCNTIKSFTRTYFLSKENVPHCQ